MEVCTGCMLYVHYICYLFFITEIIKLLICMVNRWEVEACHVDKVFNFNFD